MCSDSSAKSGGPLGGGGGGGNEKTGGGGKSQQDLQQVSDDVVTTKPSQASPNPSGAGSAAPDPFQQAAPDASPVSSGTAPQPTSPSISAPGGTPGGSGGNNWVDALSNPHSFAVKKFGEGVMNAPKGSDLGARFANGGKNLHDSLFGPTAPQAADAATSAVGGGEAVGETMNAASTAASAAAAPAAEAAGTAAAGEAAGAASGIGGILSAF